MPALSIWLYGHSVATLEEDPFRHRLRLLYTPNALDRFDAGTPLLSIRFPLTTETYPNAVVRAFVDGLLPEGDVRRLVAEELHLRADDTFELITALGRDSAGALVIQPQDEPQPPPATTTTAEPIDEVALESLVANLRSAPLGVSDRVRLSLGGVQEKLLMTRMPDGGWGRPVDGTPSTHILKPELREYPNTVANEAFCMRVAKSLNLSTANIESTLVGRRPVLVVERYDRLVGDDSGVERVHQEDMCQALGVPPRRKYQAEGGPSLKQVAGILTKFRPGRSRDFAASRHAEHHHRECGCPWQELLADPRPVRPAPSGSALRSRVDPILRAGEANVHVYRRGPKCRPSHWRTHRE